LTPARGAPDARRHAQITAVAPTLTAAGSRGQHALKRLSP